MKKVQLEIIKNNEFIIVRDQQDPEDLYYRTRVINYEYNGVQWEGVDLSFINFLDRVQREPSLSINLNIKEGEF